MNFLRGLLQSGLIERLGWTLLHSLWEIAGMALVLVVVRAGVKRRGPRVVYAISCGAFFFATALPVITYVLLQRPAAPKLSRDDRKAISSPARAPVPAGTEMERHWTPVDRAGGPPIRTFYVRIERATSWIDNALPWIVYTWAGGVLVLSLWNLGGWIAVQRLRSLSTSGVDSLIERTAGDIARRLGLRRSVRLLQSVVVDSPLVIGVLKPLVLLPVSLLTELPADQIQSLLAHELAHVLRHDYLINLLQCAVETLFFYHPGIWWMSARIRSDREECCDDLAIGVTQNRGSYVRALAALVGARSPALMPAGSGGQVLMRLRRLMGIYDTNESCGRWLSGAVVLFLCIAAVISIALQRVAVAVPVAGEITVHGQVVGPDGKPIADADVSVVGGHSWSRQTTAAHTHSRVDGSFEMSVHPSDFDSTDGNWRSGQVIAAAAGFGPASALLGKAADAGGVVLKLVRDDVPIEGRILNSKGEPLAGVHVTIEDVMDVWIHLDRENAAGIDPTETWDDFAFMPGFAPGISRDIATGADGRFRVTGMGSDRTVDLIIQGPGIAWGHARVVTHPGPTQIKVTQDMLQRTMTVYGSQFDYVAAPGVSVTGRVIDANTYQPLPGVSVESQRLADNTLPGDPEGVLRSVTDEDGNYRLDGFPRGEGNEIIAIPNDDQPYFMHVTKLPDTPASQQSIDFALHRGIWISGKVTDQVTGLGVVARIYYSPFRDNLNIAGVPEFNPKISGFTWPQGMRYMSHADGTYRTVAVPGHALVGVNFPDHPYRKGVGADKVHVTRTKPNGRQNTIFFYTPTMLNAVSEIDIPVQVKDATVDFQLDPGTMVNITTVDPSGKPVSGVIATRLEEADSNGGLSKTSVVQADCFSPQERRMMVFLCPAAHLGKVATIGPAEIKAGAVTVQLEPLSQVTGRIIDKNGQPLTDAAVRAQIVVPRGDEGVDEIEPPSGSDAHGRFQLTVPTGCEYELSLAKNGFYETDLKSFAVKAGETRNLGDVHVTQYWKQ